MAIDYKKTLRGATFYKRGFFVLLFLLFILSLFTFWEKIKDDWMGEGFFSEKKKPPYYEKIMKIVRPLQYSGITSFLEPRVELYLDFNNKKWELRNIFEFDETGNVKLHEDRFGLCGELSSFVYNKIKPLLGAKYDIKFLKAAEAGYFLHTQSSHIVLSITPKLLFNRESYIIDPSFKRYARKEEFDDYFFTQEAKILKFEKESDRHVSLPINTTYPLLIKNDFLVNLVVTDIDKKFDRNNYMIALTVHRKNKFASRIMLGFQMIDGDLNIIENKYLSNILLGPKKIKAAKEKIQSYVEAIAAP